MHLNRRLTQEIFCILIRFPLKDMSKIKWGLVSFLNYSQYRPDSAKCKQD